MVSGLNDGDHTLEFGIHKGTINAYRFIQIVESFLPQGELYSEWLACSPAMPFKWGKLSLDKSAPPKTSLRIDVLDCNDKVLMSDVSSGGA